MVRIGGVAVPVQKGKQRALLAALLLNAGRARTQTSAAAHQVNHHGRAAVSGFVVDPGFDVAGCPYQVPSGHSARDCGSFCP